MHYFVHQEPLIKKHLATTLSQVVPVMVPLFLAHPLQALFPLNVPGALQT